MTKEQTLSHRYPDVERQAFYIESIPSSLFAWQHKSRKSQWRNHVVIICAPMGYEYTHSHRSLRHLADTLAQQGFIALRFDFHGMGDSPGTELDSQRIATWQQNIDSVVAFARANYPGSQLCLAGLRFGATLAYLAAQRVSPDHLLLWEPIIKGKAYVREMMALARFSANAMDEKDYIESAGFLMTKETAEEIKTINLLNHLPGLCKNLLLLTRDDRPADDSLIKKITEEGLTASQVSQPGFADMMAEPQETQVPLAAIDFISEWVSRHADTWIDYPPSQQHAPSTLVLNQSAGRDILLEEKPYWYDSDQSLFSISSQPLATRDKTLPAVILVNSGSVHHVGPNRIYCQLARTFAALGYFVLRLDLEGLGDSCKAVAERENHPYQKNAVANIFQAMDSLMKQGVANQFIVGGICSGAHTAYHAGLTTVEKNARGLLSEILLINPLTFYWQEGMSLAIPSDVQNLHDTAYYRQSMRDLDKWKKLLTGKASTVYIFKYALERGKNLSKGFVKDLKEIMLGPQTRLAIDIEQIIAQKISIRFLLSSRDPGYDIIKSQARRSLRSGLNNKTISLDLVDGADHTFSRKEKRDRLLDLIRVHYSQPVK